METKLNQIPDPETPMSEFSELLNNRDSVLHKVSTKQRNRFIKHTNNNPSQFSNWRWQMKHQVHSQEQAKNWLNLDPDEIMGFNQLKDLFNAGVTPYYMGLMDPDNPLCPIRLQSVPRGSEKVDKLGMHDPLDEVPHSPVKEVVHVYPDRVAFCVAQLCPVYCRYCFRKRRDDEQGLHFNRSIIDRGVNYIRENPAIRDVLITGGDAFIASDSAIDHLLNRICAIPHVEMVRFGTRTPVTLPYRVTKNLCKIIGKHQKVFVNTHFNCAEEMTPDASQAIANLVNAGIPVGNQAVLLRGVNNTPEKMMNLCRSLLKNRVRPYYVFHPHAVEGTEHLRVTVDEGLKVMGSLRGNITGMGIPVYALDTPSGKIPIQKNYILARDGHDLVFETIRGEIWREKGVNTPLPELHSVDK